VGLEGFGDLIESGLHDVVLGIAGPCGVSFFGQSPAGPGASFALLEAGFLEAIGVVLKMDAWIANKHVLGRMGHEPMHSRIGEGEFDEHGLIA